MAIEPSIFDLMGAAATKLSRQKKHHFAAPRQRHRGRHRAAKLLSIAASYWQQSVHKPHAPPPLSAPGFIDHSSHASSRIPYSTNCVIRAFFHLLPSTSSSSQMPQTMLAGTAFSIILGYGRFRLDMMDTNSSTGLVRRGLYAFSSPTVLLCRP